jgi:hypothetical protein
LVDSAQIAALDKCLQSPQLAILAKAASWGKWYRYVVAGYVVYENAPPPWLCSPGFDGQLLQRTLQQAEPTAQVVPLGSPEAAALATCVQSPQRAALAKALQYETPSRSYVVAGYVVYEQAPPSWLCSLPDGVVRALVERLPGGSSLHSKGPNRPSGGTASP